MNTLPVIMPPVSLPSALADGYNKMKFILCKPLVKTNGNEHATCESAAVSLPSALADGYNNMKFILCKPLIKTNSNEHATCDSAAVFIAVCFS